jgi:hypothetical protein
MVAPDSATNWPGIITALSGLIFGASGIWLTYRSRPNPIREEMHRRQMNAIDVLMEFIREAFEDAQKMVYAGGKEKQALAFKVIENDAKWTHEIGLLGHYLPTELLFALQHFRVTMLNTALQAGKGGIQPTSLVSDAYNALMNSVRNAIGVDTMSKELQLMFGSNPETPP